MNTKRGKLNRKLFSMSALMLAALFLLSVTLPAMGTSATGVVNEAGQESQTVIARAQGSTGEDVPLAGEGEWAQASVEVNSAPEDAVVSAVRVKYHIVYSEPSDLEVQLLTSGAEASHTLWNKGSAEGDVLTQSTEEIAAFQGAPVNGTWSLAVQGGNPQGYIDDFSIIVYYEMEMPVLQIEGEGAPGTPGFLRLPEGATPASPPPDEDEKPPVEGSSVIPQDVPPGAIIIKTEDFEGSFPNSGWSVFDNSNDGYTRYWDDAHCDACGGDWAAWPADGGANRVDPCAGNNYPNNMEAWMIYGPFDLSDADDAGTEFVMWHETETGYDWVFFGFSDDGYNFTGWFFDGYAPCTLWNAYYGSMLGDPSVWVAWVFYSDGGVRRDGPWVDDIVIWKEVGTTVKIAPPEKVVWLGATFTYDVVIEDAFDLGAFEFELTYNPSCITVPTCDATLGPFLGSTGRSVAEVGPTCGVGSITYGAYSWGSSPGPNGDGVLATVTFQAGMNQCDSALRLPIQNVSVTDTAGNQQSVSTGDGIVHVVPPDCPTPPDCPEDLNNDGVVNIIDIMLVASKWGQSCPTR
jgi:hypothetical protein